MQYFLLLINLLVFRGCPCWFDIQANDTRCACCKNGGVQCGYPMNNFCWRRRLYGGQISRINRGCPGAEDLVLQSFCCQNCPMTKTFDLGVAQWWNTLSSTGSPCPWDVTDRSCSWCSPDGWLCPLQHNIDGSGGDSQVQKTYKGKNRNVCVSESMAARIHKQGRYKTICKKSK